MNNAARSSSVLRVLLGAFVTNPLVPLVLTAVIIVLGMFVQFSTAMGHDLSWLLYAAGRMVAGADIYGLDLFEWNQPMILWALAPAVEISERHGVSIFTSARLWIGALGLVGLALSAVIARYALAEERPVLRRYLVALMAYALFILPGDAFGQREHIIMMLLMPELLLLCAHAGNWAVPRRWVALAGIAAGLAIAIKPQYGLVVLGWEVYLVTRRGMLFFVRRDLVMLALVGLAYWTAVLVLAPGYLGHVVPLAVDSYWVYQTPLHRIVKMQDWGLLVAALAVVPLVWGRRDLREYAMVLLVVATGLYGVALLQGTGWPYHLLPFRMVLLILASLPILRLLGGWRGEVARVIWEETDDGDEVAVTLGPPKQLGLVWQILAALSVGMGVTAAVLSLPNPLRETIERGEAWRRGRTLGHVAAVERGLREHAAGGSVWVVSPSLVTIFPAVLHADVGWSSRFAGQFLPAVVARYERQDPRVPERLSAARVEEIERFVRDAAIEDLRRRPPQLILIDGVRRKKVFRGVPFDFLEFFLEDPRFAEIWSHYEPVGQIGRFDAAVLRTASEGVEDTGSESAPAPASGPPSGLSPGV
jgi:hypothetical protein